MALKEEVLTSSKKEFWQLLDLDFKESLSNFAQSTKDQSYTMLHYAAFKGNLSAVKVFLDQSNINVNARTNSGLTPLHIAVATNQTEIVKSLIAKGALFKAKNPVYVSPLDLAFAQRSDEILKVMGIADPKAHPLYGQNKLMQAVMTGNIDAVKFFMSDPKIDVNQKNEQGMTPLHMALKYKRIDIAKELISHGAKIDARDQNYLTPLDLAFHQKNDDLLVAMGIKNPKTDPRYGQPDTGQTALNQQMIDYCLARGYSADLVKKDGAKTSTEDASIDTQQKLISTLFLDTEINSEGRVVSPGECNGWTLLKEYYYGSGRKEEFNAIRNFMATANVADKSLKTNENIPDLLKSKYKTGEEIFETTIQNLVIFSQTAVKEKILAQAPGLVMNDALSRAADVNIEQSDRLRQWNLAGDSRLALNAVFNGQAPGTTKLSFSTQEVSQLLTFSQNWPNTWVDIRVSRENGSGHNISVSVTPEGKLRLFDSNSYFSPEIEYENVEELAQTIKNVFPQEKNISLNGFSMYQFGQPGEKINNFPLDKSPAHPVQLPDKFRSLLINNSLASKNIPFLKWLAKNDERSGNFLLGVLEDASENREINELREFVEQLNQEGNEEDDESLAELEKELELEDIEVAESTSKSDRNSDPQARAETIQSMKQKLEELRAGAPVKKTEKEEVVTTAPSNK